MKLTVPEILGKGPKIDTNVSGVDHSIKVALQVGHPDGLRRAYAIFLQASNSEAEVQDALTAMIGDANHAYHQAKAAVARRKEIADAIIESLTNQED